MHSTHTQYTTICSLYYTNSSTIAVTLYPIRDRISHQRLITHVRGRTADMGIKYLEVTVRAGTLVALCALHILFSIPAQTADLSYFLPSRHVIVTAIRLTGIMWSELLNSEITIHEFNQAWSCRTEQAHKYCPFHDMDVIYSLVQQLKNYNLSSKCYIQCNRFYDGSKWNWSDVLWNTVLQYSVYCYELKQCFIYIYIYIYHTKRETE